MHQTAMWQVSLKDFLEFLYNERWVNDDRLPAALDAPSTSRSSGLYVAQLFELDPDPFKITRKPKKQTHTLEVQRPNFAHW